MPFKPEPGKEYLNTREASDIYGCTMGRIRQLALEGKIWSGHLHGRALVYDRAEIEAKAKELPSTGRPRKRRSA